MPWSVAKRWLDSQALAELRSLWDECLTAVRLQEPPEMCMERLVRIEALRERLEATRPSMPHDPVEAIEPRC